MHLEEKGIKTRLPIGGKIEKKLVEADHALLLLCLLVVINQCESSARMVLKLREAQSDSWTQL